MRKLKIESNLDLGMVATQYLLKNLTNKVTKVNPQHIIFRFFLFVEFLEGIPCIVNLHSLHYPIVHLRVEDSHVLEALLME